jgi:RNA polymerase sigma-70 factor (ECF subfamily)
MINRFSSDQELWDAIKNDEEKALSYLFDRYWEKVFTVAFSVARDREACSGIVHDIFLNIWLKREQLNISIFSAYLSACARYHAYRYVKTSKRIPLSYTEDIAMIPHLAVNYADENIRYGELKKQVEDNLEALPKRCKEIFTLSRHKHLSNDEIAAHLDISKRSVENQLTHALHHLRIALKSFL